MMTCAPRTAPLSNLGMLLEGCKILVQYGCIAPHRGDLTAQRLAVLAPCIDHGRDLRFQLRALLHKLGGQDGVDPRQLCHGNFLRCHLRRQDRACQVR